MNHFGQIIPIFMVVFQLCEKVWRPSRIESECIHGEGLFFTFPDEDCSLFFDQILSKL